MGERRFHLIAYGLSAGVLLICAGVYGWLLRDATDFHFAHRWALVLVAGAGLVAWSGFHLRRRRQGTMAFPRVADLSAVKPGIIGRLSPLPRALRIGALALIAVALARPQTSQPDPDIQVEGIDLALAIDLSNSMSERDLDPRLTRLDVAKQVLAQFIRRRRTDRMALVVFGREPYIMCPLTLDYHVLLGLVDWLHLEEPPSPEWPLGRKAIVDGHGTAIGDAIDTALNRVRKTSTKTKAIILLTDGNSNMGHYTPITAARFAAIEGVKIYTILIGRQDLNVDEKIVDPMTGQPAAFEPTDPKTLEEVSAMTGGMPFVAQDASALQQRFQTILDDLDRSKLREAGVVSTELFPVFLDGAAALLLLEVLLALTRFRRFP